MWIRLNRTCRWVVLLASGAMLLQAPGCLDLNTALQFTQTGLLAALVGGVLYLAKHV